MVTATEYCLLGPLVVRRGDVTLPVAPGKQRAVLAALLLSADRVVPLDELTEVLWGSAPPPSARVSLQNHVMRLRKSLGAPGRRAVCCRRRLLGSGRRASSGGTGAVAG
jgi:DNA-binding SARP family transcriptional activator